jgi:ketosteroid isomerase-like protein
LHGKRYFWEPWRWWPAGQGEILRGSMSEENLELVRREYVAFASRDWAALAEIWHPDIEYEALDPATYRGHEELREGFMGWSKLFAEWWVRADEIVDAGDQVVVVESFGGRGMKGSEADTQLEQAVARLISFRDGKIWRVKEYPSLGEALEAAGLRE